MLIEICVDSPGGLAAAVAGGANRIELCAALELGGLTPSTGLVTAAARCGVPVVAMIRPRPGDFVWSAAEVTVMEAEIAAMRDAGLAGVVLGASRPDGRLDDWVLARLAGAAKGLQRVLHRAFDLVPDVGEAVETAVGLGFDRILTSGGAARVEEGLDRLRETFRAARGRIEVMPGSGVTPGTVAAVLSAVPATEIHASCAGPVPQADGAVRLGFSESHRRETEAARVRALRLAAEGV